MKLNADTKRVSFDKSSALSEGSEIYEVKDLHWQPEIFTIGKLLITADEDKNGIDITLEYNQRRLFTQNSLSNIK